MTRTTAREIAIQLGFAASGGRLELSELIEAFFAPNIMQRCKVRTSFIKSSRMKNRWIISAA